MRRDKMNKQPKRINSNKLHFLYWYCLISNLQHGIKAAQPIHRARMIKLWEDIQCLRKLTKKEYWQIKYIISSDKLFLTLVHIYMHLMLRIVQASIFACTCVHVCMYCMIIISPYWLRHWLHLNGYVYVCACAFMFMDMCVCKGGFLFIMDV